MTNKDVEELVAVGTAFEESIIVRYSNKPDTYPAEFTVSLDRPIPLDTRFVKGPAGIVTQRHIDQFCDQLRDWLWQRVRDYAS